jgi:cytidine deaminase
LNRNKNKIAATKYSKLTEKQKLLLEKALEATKTAYNPYTKYYVGAAILTKDGTIITGSNVANAAWLSICAERSAIARAVSMGYKRFEAIAIIARHERRGTKRVTPPCGACRQFIFEFSQISNKDIEIIMSTTKKDKVVVTSINKLLPMGFGLRKSTIKAMQKKYKK